MKFRIIASLVFTVLAGVTLSFPAAADETSDDGAGLPVWLIWTQADDDGDVVNNVQDAFPQDASETVDTDDDGIGNNADEDDDGDGVADDIDLFPLDPSESEDFDGDGIGNFIVSIFCFTVRSRGPAIVIDRVSALVAGRLG